MTVRGERAIDRCFRVPSASVRFTDESALDSSRVITELDNNLAHQCEESVRPLFVQSGYNLTTLGINDYVGYIADITRDVPQPSPANVQHVWQEIGFSRRTARRWGPFSIVPDAGDMALEAKPRPVRLIARLIVPAGLSVCGACAIMTRSDDANEIMTGRYLAAAETTGITAGTVELVYDLAPEAFVDDSYPATNTAPSGGTQSTALRSFYLWFGVSAWDIGTQTVNVLEVSGFEVR